jgi:hypothetical protein
VDDVSSPSTGSGSGSGKTLNLHKHIAEKHIPLKKSSSHVFI